MHKFHKFTFSFVALSACMHIFCCGLPLLTSIVNILFGFGAMASFSTELSFIHEYENFILIVSGFMLILGYVAQYASFKIDCKTHASCSHEPCSPKKTLSFKIQMAATLIFLFNLFVILFVDDHSKLPI